MSYCEILILKRVQIMIFVSKDDLQTFNIISIFLIFIEWILIDFMRFYQDNENGFRILFIFIWNELFINIYKFKKIVVSDFYWTIKPHLVSFPIEFSLKSKSPSNYSFSYPQFMEISFTKIRMQHYLRQRNLSHAKLFKYN